MLDFLKEKPLLNSIFQRFEFSLRKEYEAFEKEFNDKLQPKLLKESKDLAEASVEKMAHDTGSPVTGLTKIAVGSTGFVIHIVGLVLVTLCIAILAS